MNVIYTRLDEEMAGNLALNKTIEPRNDATCSHVDLVGDTAALCHAYLYKHERIKFTYIWSSNFIIFLGSLASKGKHHRRISTVRHQMRRTKCLSRL